MKRYAIFLVFLLLLLSLTGGCMPEEDISLGDLIRLIRHVIESDEEGQISSTLEKAGTALENGAEGYVSADFHNITTAFDIINLFASYEFQYSQSHPKQRFNEQCKLNFVEKKVLMASGLIE